jgi:hypothetical protein
LRSNYDRNRSLDILQSDQRGPQAEAGGMHLSRQTDWMNIVRDQGYEDLSADAALVLNYQCIIDVLTPVPSPDPRSDALETPHL